MYYYSLSILIFSFLMAICAIICELKYLRNRTYYMYAILLQAITIINIFSVFFYFVLSDNSVELFTNINIITKLYSIGSIILIILYNFSTSRISDAIVKNLRTRVLFTLAAATGLMSVDTNSLFSKIPSTYTANNSFAAYFNTNIFGSNFVTLAIILDICCKLLGISLFFLMILSIEVPLFQKILLKDISSKG